MKVETGKQAVWQHAKECGISEDIALIAKYFDIKDVSIIGNGKMTYVDERPRKMHRVPAHPTGKGDIYKALENLRAENEKNAKRLKK